MEKTLVIIEEGKPGWSIVAIRNNVSGEWVLRQAMRNVDILDLLEEITLVVREKIVNGKIEYIAYNFELRPATKVMISANHPSFADIKNNRYKVQEVKI